MVLTKNTKYSKITRLLGADVSHKRQRKKDMFVFLHRKADQEYFMQ